MLLNVQDSRMLQIKENLKIFLLFKLEAEIISSAEINMYCNYGRIIKYFSLTCNIFIKDIHHKLALFYFNLL